MNVTDSTFYRVELPDSDTLHNDRTEAIDYLRENANGVDPENDEVSVVEIDSSGDDNEYSIKELSGMTIALELLNGGDEQ